MSSHDKLIVKSVESYTALPQTDPTTAGATADPNELRGRYFWPLTLPRRYFVAVLAFMGFCNLYILRVNLSVAIVSMTSAPVTPEGEEGAAPEFSWDSRTKGLILSSFFYGYIVTQLPGGWLASRYGGRVVFGYGIVITAVLSLLTPVAARGGAGMLAVLRVLQGLAEGDLRSTNLRPISLTLATPDRHLHSKWSPCIERSRLVTIAFSGSYVGTVIALPVSGLLADNYGWPSIFYVFGIVALIWAGFWFGTVAECPREDKWITEEEVNYITCSLGPPSPTHKLPWRTMLRSRPVWAINCAHFAENWGFYLLLTLLPTYMSHTFGYNLSKSGFISALPYLVMAVILQSSGVLADWLRVRGFTTTQVRKLFTCGAFLAQTTFVMAAAFITTNSTGSIICLTAAVGLGGFCWTGFGVNHLDIAPNYAGLLMGVSNTFATIPGILSPLIAGFMTVHGAPEEWRAVFMISGAIYFIGCLLYGFLASGEPQQWAEARAVDLTTSCMDSD